MENEQQLKILEERIDRITTEYVGKLDILQEQINKLWVEVKQLKLTNRCSTNGHRWGMERSCTFKKEKHKGLTQFALLISLRSATSVAFLY